MKVIFKNVGQGDSIILEWECAGEKKIGIIDCKKYNNTNPVLDEIKKLGTKKIEFIFLSHPHIDHFSGMLELLDYCGSNNIVIKYFAHTMGRSPQYIQWAVFEKEDTVLLAKITQKVAALYSSKIIVQRGDVSFNWSVLLNEKWTMRCLAPSEEEHHAYIKQVDLLKFSNADKCSQAANLLASILQISSQENTIALLTSDAELQAFDTIQERCKEVFDNKLILCQVPHHGSINNHKISFWKKFRKNEDCPAVISAGQNAQYAHPDEEVVRDFMKNGFRVYATNNVNGMASFILGHKQQALSIALDDESELEEYFNTEGDKIFELQSQAAIAIAV